MDCMEAFQESLKEFEKTVAELEKNKHPFAGFFGLGKTPADDACHEILDRKTEELTGAVLEGNSREEAEALGEAVLRAESRFSGPSWAGMTLIAVQRHALRLIPLMSEEKRQELRTWFESTYPKRQRFPIQREICSLLAQQAPEAGGQKA